MAVTSGIAHLADTGKQITAGQRHVFVSEGGPDRSPPPRDRGRSRRPPATDVPCSSRSWLRPAGRLPAVPGLARHLAAQRRRHQARGSLLRTVGNEALVAVMAERAGVAVSPGPSGRKGSGELSIALMTSAWAAGGSLVIRQPDRPAVFSGRPGPVRSISVASAANRLLRYRCPRRWCPWPAERAALECRITGPARRIRRTRQPVTPKGCPGVSAGSARLVNAIPAAGSGGGRPASRAPTRSSPQSPHVVMRPHHIAFYLSINQRTSETPAEIHPANSWREGG